MHSLDFNSTSLSKSDQQNLNSCSRNYFIPRSAYPLFDTNASNFTLYIIDFKARNKRKIIKCFDYFSYWFLVS